MLLSNCVLKTVVLLGMCFAASLYASEYEDIVERAFEAMDDNYEESWSFIEISTREEVRYEASYDPRRQIDDRWTLVSVDGRAPTEKESKSFLDEKAEILDDKSGEDDDEDVDIKPGTLTLLEETSDYWLFSFVPTEEEEDMKFMEYIDGKMKVVKDGHFVEYLDLRSPKPFKPAMGVKIDTFLTRITFGPAIPEGPIVPMSVDVQVKGKALFAIKFDEKETIHYQDYEYAGPD